MVQVLLRTTACFLALFLLPLLVHAEEGKPVDFNFGIFSFSLTPRISEDSSINDISFGMMYSESLGGEIQFRSTQTAKNEEIPGTDDSLNAIKGTTYEVFALPVQYRFVQKPNLKLIGGAGLYYEYDKLSEKGFFTLNFLEDDGLERVNSYKNDFTMHLVGPLLDGRVQYNAEWINIGFTAGIVPVFFAGFAQKLGIDPLMHPDFANLSEKTGDSPYFFLSLDSIFFKYLNVTLSYDYARLTKKIINFDDNFDWIFPKQTIVTRSVMIEVSGLLPLGSGMSIQAGYGYMHNFISLDSASAIEEGKHFLILSTKKIFF